MESPNEDVFDEILKIIQAARLAKKKGALKPKAISVEVEKIEPAKAMEPEQAEDLGEDPDEEELEKLKKMLGG